MPVRDPEPEAEVEGRPVRFQYVDDVVEAYVQGLRLSLLMLQIQLQLPLLRLCLLLRGGSC